MEKLTDFSKGDLPSASGIYVDSPDEMRLNNNRSRIFSHPLPLIFFGLFAALTLSACGTGQQISPADAPVPTPRSVVTQPVLEGESAAPVETSTVASQAAPVPEARPDESAQVEPVRSDETPPPVPSNAPRNTGDTVIEVVRVTEKPTGSTEITEVVETADRLIERKEQTETSERIIDRVEVDEQRGRIEETVEVIESTKKTVDVIEIDKQTGAAVETIVEAAPVEKRRGRVTIVVEDNRNDGLSGSMDDARRFAGPGGIDTVKLAGFGIVAVQAGMHANERERLMAICEAFISPTPDIAASAEGGMITIWPISSAAHAEELNTGSGPSGCDDAIERYGLTDAKRAIADAERTGWILDNRGPYLLAWSPPEARGNSGALVLLADLSGITTAEDARAVMQRWANDVETNSALWNGGEWDTALLRPIIESWREEFGTRTLMLLGPVGG